MVRLVLVSPKGNGVRHFPYSGYLGLTPIKVEGVVITRLDQDLKALPTSSIIVSVRCYELRLGPTGVLQSNILADYSKTLWEKPDNQEYGDIGDMELPFRITIPASAGGHSTASYVEYRCLWRVEAMLRHTHLIGIGSRQVKHVELPLIRYDLPPLPPHLHRRLPLNGVPPLDRETYKPRAPRIRYSIVTPTSAVGPLDLVSISLFLLPSDASVSIRSASAVIERRIQTKESGSLLAPETFSPPSSPHVSPPSRRTVVTSTSSLSSSSSKQESISQFAMSAAAIDQTLLASPPQSPTTPYAPSDLRTVRTSINPVVATESSGAFLRDRNGIFSNTLTVPWPVPKSSSRWAIGETLQTGYVSVKFFIRVKLIVTSPTGTESLDLEDHELFVVSTNNEERQSALSNHELEAARSKSRSPKHSRGLPEDDAPACPQTRQREPLTSPHPSSSRAMKVKTPRRPHTSGGSRDTFSTLDVLSKDAHKCSRPGTVDSGGAGPMRMSLALRMIAVDSERPGSTGSNRGNVPSSAYRGSADVREWEQELARIEVQSRRSSDMVGFAVKRHRPPTALPLASET